MVLDLHQRFTKFNAKVLNMFAASFVDVSELHITCSLCTSTCIPSLKLRRYDICSCALEMPSSAQHPACPPHHISQVLPSLVYTASSSTKSCYLPQNVAYASLSQSPV
ncbi:hypothetical protein TWF569_006357 [Orbilia oligospora]|uniref:Uncharacterized protein n=1 Tax=Orbilia oligospora TaxID=2813651 RepID=A0A7C8JEQ3_ORBOL|nr:hypothetical protein TWF102_010607 [Orbilia oligospora]KAF3100463.1 hypothetical protein TWF103_008192 [Orbilia oligospora]KAF3110906.1 hypothetical protein TWF706_000372 [Orbilia oligospora]KAF3139041.1 hypothetical protein TWF594_006796 [Orbilia oligospora]KAF3146341.1 hypothetical protein TWF569_006357 [Orbilia oligospora]